MTRRMWNLTEVIAVADRYPQEGPKRLATLLGRSEGSVTGLATRYGLRSLHRRERQARTRAEERETVNVHFFDTPSADVAYVLGVVFAWGTVKTNTRHVLRLRAPICREPLLRNVLEMMGSKHIDQRGRRRILVEVGNHLLVASLVRNYGQPPDRDDPDPPFPMILGEFIPDFARGLLDAAGDIHPDQARWSGSPRAVIAVRHAIAAVTGQDATEVVRVGRRMIAVWKGAVEVAAIRRWLACVG